MRILYLITSLEGGGAQAAIPRIFDVLRAEGHAPMLVAIEPRGGGAVARLEAAGIEHELLCQQRCGKVAAVLALAQLLRRAEVDLIWSSLDVASVVAGVSGALCGTPVVSWKQVTRIRWYTRLLHRLSAFWIGDCAAVSRRLVDVVGVAPARVLTWPIYAPLPRSDAGLHPAPAWHGQGLLHIGSMGRLHRSKNHRQLVEACAHLLREHPELRNRVRLTVVGDGPDQGRLRRLVHQLVLDGIVAFPGAVQDVQRFLATLHLYVQCSRTEGMCLAGHEALAAGIPVLTTPKGELANSVRRSGAGWVIEGGFADGLARCIGESVANPERLARMAASGRAFMAAAYGQRDFEAAGRSVLRRLEALVASRRLRATGRRGGTCA